MNGCNKHDKKTVAELNAEGYDDNVLLACVCCQTDEIERLRAVVDAAKKFEAKVDAALPHINDIFVFAHVHNQRYQGEPFGEEQTALKQALAALEQDNE